MLQQPVMKKKILATLTRIILPIGGLYGTYHQLREPETTIDKDSLFKTIPVFYDFLSTAKGQGDEKVWGVCEIVTQF